MELDLPPLNDEPNRYPDFCLSLSTPLIHCLTSVFTEAANQSESNLILSVGSGSGRLEAHLQDYWSSTLNCNLSIHGVEIHVADNARPVNRYLPEQNCSTVQATWQLSPDLAIAGALLFVYPRDSELVLRYLQAASNQESNPLQAVVWLGPRADYRTFVGALQSALDAGLRDTLAFGPVEIIGAPGMAEYEMMALIRRKVV